MTEVYRKLVEVHTMPGNPPKLRIIYEESDDAKALAEMLAQWAIGQVGLRTVEVVKHEVGEPDGT